MSDGSGFKLPLIRRRLLALLSWRVRPFGLSRMLVVALILLLVLAYFDQVNLPTLLVGLGFFTLATITIRLDQRRYLRRMRRVANTRKALSEQLLRADVQITDFAEIFSGIHDAIVLLDRRLNILLVSGTARQLFPSALPGIP
jgi:hypothetical protein